MKETAPHCVVGNMIARLQNYVYTCNPKDVLVTQQQSQFNLFPTDVQASGYYPQSILNYYAEKEIEIDWYPNTQEILSEGVVDYTAISNYHTDVISSRPDKKEPIGAFVRHLQNPHVELISWGWGIDPIGIRISLNEIYDRYKLPIFIFENGLGVHDGDV